MSRPHTQTLQLLFDGGHTSRLPCPVTSSLVIMTYIRDTDPFHPRPKPIPMSFAILTVTSLSNVHDINVTSAKGRKFVIDICESQPNAYTSTVTVLDTVSNPQGSWLLNTQPFSMSPKDNFRAALDLIQSYLRSKDPSDSIYDINNPCNCPFVSEVDQNLIAASLGFDKKVKVNDPKN